MFIVRNIIYYLAVSRVGSYIPDHLSVSKSPVKIDPAVNSSLGLARTNRQTFFLFLTHLVNSYYFYITNRHYSLIYLYRI